MSTFQGQDHSLLLNQTEPSDGTRAIIRMPIHQMGQLQLHNTSRGSSSGSNQIQNSPITIKDGYGSESRVQWHLRLDQR